MLLNVSKNINLKAVNEVYFGKTSEILTIEKQLDKFRNKYMNQYIRNILVNNDEDLLKLNRMFEDAFGFGCFSLNVINQPIANAYTIPIDYRWDLSQGDIRRNLIVDKGTFKFNKSADYTCMVYIYSGVIFNSEFTTGEVMACILHEVGHNFYGALDGKHGVMIGVFNAFHVIYDVYLALLAAQNPETITTSIQAIKDLFTSTDTYYKFKENLKRTLRNNGQLFIKIYDILKWLKSLPQTVAYSIANVIDLASLGLLNILIGGFNFVSHLNIISNIFLPLSYTNERAADNFATMYGYGADTISLQNKLNSLNIKQTSKLKNMYMKIPLLSNLYALNVNIGTIILTAFDEHPIGISRCSDQLNMLKRELQKTDLDPKMKKVIQADIKVCEDNIKKITDISGGLKNKDYIRNLYYKSLYETSDSKDLKDLLLDDINKFDAYDSTYADKKGRR